MTNKDKSDSLPTIWFMLSNAIPPVGVFLWLKHRDKSPNKAKRALLAGLTGIPIGIIAGYIFNNHIF